LSFVEESRGRSCSRSRRVGSHREARKLSAKTALPSAVVDLS
jgi:hypothetical protein